MHPWSKAHMPLRPALFLIATLATPAAADPISQARAIGADVIFLRHAIAPGTGDPEGFRLDDCATQRNLSDKGRVQASAIGQALRDSGLPIAAVLTSQWCRARDTATLLDLGPVTEEPGLNSFFGDPDARAPTLDRLRQVLTTMPEGDEGLTVMVTHQVVITAITGQTIPQGAAVLYDIQSGRSEALHLP
jgi:phosphohistidine phosphatase SixA